MSGGFQLVVGYLPIHVSGYISIPRELSISGELSIRVTGTLLYLIHGLNTGLFP